MSRAFIRESDSDVVEDLGELPLSTHPNYVTPAGLEQLRQRLAQLQEDPDTADSPLAQRRVRWLQARIAGAIPVEGALDATRVGFGAMVEVREVESAARHRYRIVGEDEADPERGLVSWPSPLARSLMGAKVGDVVAWKRPAGDLEIEVVDIHYEQ